MPGAGIALAGIAKRGTPVAAAKILATVVGILMHLCMTRELGVGIYAQFAYMLVIGTIAGEAFTFGWSRGITRFCSEAKAEGDKDSYAEIVALAHVTTIVCGVAISVLFSLVVWSGFLEGDLISSVSVGLWLGCFMALNAIRRRILVMERYYLLALVPMEVAIPVAVIGAVLSGVITDAASLFWLMLVCHALVFALMSAFTLSRTPARLRWPGQAIFRNRYLVPLIAILVGVMGQLLMNRMDILLVGATRELLDTGLYAAASKIAKLNPFFLGIITLVIAPKLSRQAARGDMKAFRRTFLVGSLLSTLLALPVTAVCLFAPTYLLGLAGEDFTQASSVLIVLTIGQFTNAVTGPCAAALLALSLERKFAVSYGVLTVAIAPVTYLAATKGELVHVAIVSSTLILFVNGYQLAVVRNRLRPAST